jgi:hypothetical protein
MAVNGATHPFLVDDEVNVVGMVPPARDELLPCGSRVRRVRPDCLHLDIKVVGAAIDNEVDLAAVGQQVGLVCDGPGVPSSSRSTLATAISLTFSVIWRSSPLGSASGIKKLAIGVAVRPLRQLLSPALRAYCFGVDGSVDRPWPLARRNLFTG